MFDETKRRIFARKQIKRLLRYIDREIASLHEDFPNVPIPNKKIEVFCMEGLGSVWDVEYRRVGDRIQITMHPIFMNNLRDDVKQKIVTYLYWFSICNEKTEFICVNLSDGERSSVSNFSPSSGISTVNLLPDPHFFANRGYAEINSVYDRSDLDWNERDDTIVWRGSAFGSGYTNYDIELAKHPATVQRIRLAHATNGSEIDFKFVEHFYSSREIVPLIRAGFLGERIPEYSWVKRKYAIDVDGYTNTWGNFLIRMKLGCCVFKIGSDFGFRQWYYDRLIPFEHYIPVKADLSDFFQQVEWAKTHQTDAKRIAEAGRMFANSLTFETERKVAVRTIEENWKS